MSLILPSKAFHIEDSASARIPLIVPYHEYHPETHQPSVGQWAGHSFLVRHQIGTNQTIHVQASGNRQAEIFKYQKNVQRPCCRGVVQESQTYGETKRVDRFIACDTFCIYVLLSLMVPCQGLAQPAHISRAVLHLCPILTMPDFEMCCIWDFYFSCTYKTLRDLQTRHQVSQCRFGCPKWLPKLENADYSELHP